MIKYIGSKRLHLPWIADVIDALAPGGRVLDLFSGTARVGHALKRRGHAVVANDHNAYAHALATCYVQADLERYAAIVPALLERYRALEPAPGYFTETWCTQSRFFHPDNGARIDAIREAIARDALDPELEAVVLVSLMEAADRVDSTVGVQMAYLKQWAPRALRPLELRMPDMLTRASGGAGEALMLDALEAASAQPVDVAYLDPPYNSHKYLGNYHIWESLVRWDKPEVYGVARKRIDCRTRQSAFNSKREAHQALTRTLDALRATHLVISFNDEGHIRTHDMVALLAQRGPLLVLSRSARRHVGARIGIHGPSGARVGEVGKLHNREFLFISCADQEAVERVRERIVKAHPETRIHAEESLLRV